MSNLTNLYAFMRANFPEVDLSFEKPPSYVKTLTGINDKIIFCFKEDSSKQKNFGSPQFINDGDNEDIKLNITGSPLRDDNSINDLINTSIANKLFSTKPWEDNELYHSPIDSEACNEIINNVVNHKFSNDTRGWIFILCNNENESIVNSKVLLSAYISNKGFTRGSAKYMGVIKHEDVSMNNLLDRHFSMSSTSDVDICVESFFEITPYVSLKFVNNMSKENCSLKHINEQSEVVLYQQVECGKSHLLCEDLWSQVNLLQMIKNDIINAKNCNSSTDGTFMEPNYSYGTMNYDKMLEKINVILTDVVTLDENLDEAVDKSLEAVMKRVYNRPLTDITDQLWEVLKFACSYSDLKKILTFIFQISSRSSIVNIPMNHNRLGELIRELSSQRLAIPHLISTEPLELLLEIGLEKVMKDYEFIFSESKISLMEDIKSGESKVSQTEDRKNVRKSLAAFADTISTTQRKTLLHGNTSLNSTDDNIDGIRNSRFNERETEVKISKMAQIHLAIEHILMIQNNLNLENDYSLIAKMILEKPLTPFENLRKYDKLNVAITDKRVVQLVENLIPNSQKIIMRSENKFKIIENIFYFNIEQIIPSLIQKEDENDVVDKKGDAFHSINYFAITSKL